MKRFVALIAVGLSACGTAKQPSVHAVGTPSASPAAIPRIVSNLALVDSQRFPTPDLGIVYRYGGGDFRPDVYVYAKTGWSDPAGQAKAFIETLEISRQRGQLASYTVVESQPTTMKTERTSLSGHEVVLGLVIRNQPRDSYFAVVTLPDRFVKFRITQDPSPEAIPRARKFAQDWVAAAGLARSF